MLGVVLCLGAATSNLPVDRAGEHGEYIYVGIYVCIYHLCMCMYIWVCRHAGMYNYTCVHVTAGMCIYAFELACV